jgi:hypothetical protein
MTTPADTFMAPQALGAPPFELGPRRPRQELRRFLVGLALAATFGLALGAGRDMAAMAAHAVGVPIAFVVVALVGGPAFYVALAHAGVDVSALALAGALSRGTASAGLVLAGLAPTMLLLAVTCESQVTVAVYGVLGLAAGGCLGLRAMFRELERGQLAWTVRARLPHLAFAIFAGVLSLRIWWSVLALLGGGR